MIDVNLALSPGSATVISSASIAATIAYFIPFEVCNFIETPRWLGSFAALRCGAVIAMVGVKAVIDMPAEMVGAMKPWARANKDTSREPFRTIVTVGSAAIRIGVVVAVGAIRRDSYIDADLGIDLRDAADRDDYGDRRECENTKLTHVFNLLKVLV